MVRSRVLIGAALVLVLVLAAGARWRLLDVPLERDEGEYAYAAQLILRGVPSYEHVYSMKPSHGCSIRRPAGGLRRAACISGCSS